MKKILISVFALAVVLMAVLILFKAQKEQTVQAPNTLDTAFVIDGKEFALKDGKAESVIDPDAASVSKLTVFGSPAYGDLDADGDQDAALLLQYEVGGSGTFYYAALALLDGAEYKGSGTMFLGDRIAPQTIEIREGRAVYSFADRNAGEPMSAQPSVGKSVWVHYDAERNEIGEWVKDFEGESDFSERFSAVVDRVSVVFEQKEYTSYRLITNGLVREGELNTERGFEDDTDATVYVLNWQKPEGEQMLYVRLTAEPDTLYALDGKRRILNGSALTREK